MKMTRFILLALGTLGFLPPLQSQTPADSIITEVVVYMGSARVTRSVEVDLATGENVLQFSGLPTDLDINQMQLGLVEGVPIRLDNLKFEPGKDREDTEEEKRLKDEIEAQVFIDGMLASRVTIPYTIPGDELELSLGVDDFIIVNRKETLRETQYTGLIDKTTVLKRAFTIEVQNFHSMDHQVKVFERFPVSRNEKIAVKRWAPDKSQVEFEEDTGVFFWEDRLIPKQSKEYKVAYDVVHPREWNLKDQI